MAGRRSSGPGAEVRDKRTTVRWTESEFAMLEKERERRGITYLVDVPRTLTLERLKFLETLGRQAEGLEKVREVLGLESLEDAAWVLVLQQLKTMSSIEEKDMAEYLSWT